MKKFDLSKTYIIYHQIGDTIYARSATAEDFQKKGSDHLQEALGRPAVNRGRYPWEWEVDGESYVCESGRMFDDEYHGTWRSFDGKKHGGMEFLRNICLRQMGHWPLRQTERLSRDRELLDYPNFPEDDLNFRDLYALAVWTEAVRDLRHGVTYPEDALNLAEKAAKEAAERLEVSIAERPQFPIPLQSGWYIARSESTGDQKFLYITRDGDMVHADYARPAIISRGEMEEYAYVRMPWDLWRISSFDPRVC